MENNIRAGLARLRSLQHPSGGFAYWPGVWNTDPALDWRNDWGTTYAGHFLLEAEKAGYTLPGDMKAAWLRYQKERRAALEPAPLRVAGRVRARRRIEAARYAQAYRLYTLALAGQPEIGAMNRLREIASLLARRALDAGLGVQARRQARRGQGAGAARTGCRPSCSPTPNPYTFGSLLRDRAVVLMGMTLLGRDAETDALLEDVAGAARRTATGTARSRWRSRWWPWRRTRARSRSRASASTIDRRATRASSTVKGECAAGQHQAARRRPRRACR